MPVREWLGYVWVSLADEPPSFEETVMQEVVDRLGDVGNLDHYDVASLSVGRRIVYDVKANWKLIIENFMECYHCATIHPELTEVLPEFADGYAAQYFVNHGAEFGEGVKGFTVDGSEGVDAAPGHRPRPGPQVLRDHHQAAGVRQHGARPHHLAPDVPDGGRTAPSSSATGCSCPVVVESGRDVSKSVELFDRVNRQDFDACERTQPAMSSRMYTDGGVLVPSEHHIGLFHEWLKAKIGR